jgi:hypothetical protein
MSAFLHVYTLSHLSYHTHTHTCNVQEDSGGIYFDARCISNLVNIDLLENESVLYTHTTLVSVEDFFFLSLKADWN